MARGRRQTSSSSTGVGDDGITGGGSSSSSRHGGSAADIANLSRTLGISVAEVEAMLAAQGAGILPTASNNRTSRRSAGGATSSTAATSASSSSSNAWSNFLSDEGASSGGGKNNEEEGQRSKQVGKKRSRIGESELVSSSPVTGDSPNQSNANDGRYGDGEDSTPAVEGLAYDLPLVPPMTRAGGGDLKKKDDDRKKGDDGKAAHYGGGGVLCQTGTLDSRLVGRTKRSGPARICDLEEPMILCPDIFSKVRICYIAASSSSCHSIAIDSTGSPFGWGRNEENQLGLGPGGACDAVFRPRMLTGGWNSSKKLGIVAAAVGKSHTVLLDSSGDGYAAGSNKCGQCGVNSSVDTVASFRKCIVVPAPHYGENGNDEKSEGKKKRPKKEAATVPAEVTDRGPLACSTLNMVQVSCGEHFTVALDSNGLLYSCGLSEYGQLGNGETGEYFVTASKLAFANANRFEHRSLFVTRDESKPKGGTASPMDDKIPLRDGNLIRLSSISCGKNHTIAVEAPPGADAAKKQARRVFSWGCGNFGCLGHRLQADEYAPRVIETFFGPLFSPATKNLPRAASCGAQCSMIVTDQGHVYYWGKHRSVGEATMRPTIIDALANNGHVVKSFSAGGQTVWCGTDIGNTVSWGQGPHGELGYGSKGPKSSSKPKFVSALDKCISRQIACGYGHTLFILQNDDDEDKEALEKLNAVEGEDLEDLDDTVASAAAAKASASSSSATGKGAVGKRKGKGKGKK